MPKGSSWGVNTKSEEARARKKQQKTEKQVREKVEKEDAYWSNLEKEDQTKAALKRQEQERKRQENERKRLEAKAQAEREEQEAAALGKRGGQKQIQTPVKKTQAEIDQMKEEMEKEEKEKRSRDPRVVPETQYSGLIDAENTNRLLGIESARNVDQALNLMATLDTEEKVNPFDNVDGKKMRTAWRAYEESTLPILKMSKPGLTHSQYKDLLRKEWARSPQNPQNAANMR